MNHKNDLISVWPHQKSLRGNAQFEQIFADEYLSPAAPESSDPNFAVSVYNPMRFCSGTAHLPAIR